jgi:uncharacterized membrane protein YhdT
MADLQAHPDPNAPIFDLHDPNAPVFVFQLPFHRHVYSLNSRRSIRVWCLLDILTWQAANALELLWRFAGFPEYYETSVFALTLLFAQVLITTYRVLSGPYVVFILRYVLELFVSGALGICFIRLTDSTVEHFTGISLTA